MDQVREGYSRSPPLGQGLGILSLASLLPVHRVKKLAEFEWSAVSDGVKPAEVLEFFREGWRNMK